MPRVQRVHFRGFEGYHEGLKLGFRFRGLKVYGYQGF